MTLDACECGHVIADRITLGLHYGYPTCCIESYLQRSTLVDLDLPVPDHALTLDGSGFIPCPTHNAETAATLTALISRNRACPVPFQACPDPVVI